MKKVTLIFSIIIQFAVFQNTVAAKTLKIHPKNNFNTILRTCKGGDEILFTPGIYTKISIDSLHFSEDKPLIIRAEKKGTAIIKVDNNSGTAVKIKNCSYIAIENLTIDGGLWGTYIQSSDHIVFANNEIKNTGQEGIHVSKISSNIDIISNTIHNTGKVNSKYGEGIYVGTGSYSHTIFPDNCENIWIERNTIHDCGNGEAINIKAECFNVTILENKICNISPGTNEQYNMAAISIECGNNSLKNKYRLDEPRDIWVEKNEVYNVSNGHLNWNNGIMFGGTGVYVINNIVNNCDNYGLYANAYANLNLPIYIYNNNVNKNKKNVFIDKEIENIVQLESPGTNKNRSQLWHQIKKQ